MKQYLNIIVFGVILACATSGCRENPGPSQDCICTLQFASYLVSIHHANGAAYDSLQTASILKRTGKPYFFRQSWQDGSFGETGRYIVLTDEATKDLNPLHADTVIFRAMVGRALITERMYVFGTDSCQCHINKVAGPDSIVVN